MANNEQSLEQKAAWAANPDAAAQMLQDEQKMADYVEVDELAIFLEEHITHIESTTEEFEGQILCTPIEQHKRQTQILKHINASENEQNDEWVALEEDSTIQSEPALEAAEIEENSLAPELQFSQVETMDNINYLLDDSLVESSEENTESMATIEEIEPLDDNADDSDDADDLDEEIEQGSEYETEIDDDSVFDKIIEKISVFTLSENTYFKKSDLAQKQFKIEFKEAILSKTIETDEQDSFVFIHCLTHFLYKKNFLELFQQVCQSMNDSYKKILSFAKSKKQLHQEIQYYFQKSNSYKNEQTIEKIIDNLLALFESWSAQNNNNRAPNFCHIMSKSRLFGSQAAAMG